MKYFTILFLSLLHSHHVSNAQFYSMFFIDFDGNSLPKPNRFGVYLGSHEKSSWEYSVDNGWLNVTSVWGSNKTNGVFLSGGGFPMRTYGDFEASAKLKWEDGTYNAVGLHVGSGFPAWDIQFMYGVFQPDVEPHIRVHLKSWGGGIAYFEAPPPGEHVFTLKRVGYEVFAYLDGELIYQSSVNKELVSGVCLMFAGPKDYGDPTFKPLSVDWVYLKTFK